MQASDTSALLATPASFEVSHWLTLIRCEASWKRFVPPRAEAGKADEDLHCSTPATTPAPARTLEKDADYSGGAAGAAAWVGVGC